MNSHVASLKLLCIEPGGSAAKNPPAMQETWIWPLGQEYLLEKEMATHPNILAWENPWTEEPGGLQSVGSQRSWTWLSNWTTATFRKSKLLIPKKKKQTQTMRYHYTILGWLKWKTAVKLNTGEHVEQPNLSYMRVGMYRSFFKANSALLYNPVFVPLGIHPREMET